MEFKEIERIIKEKYIDVVDIKYVDLSGKLRHVTVDPEYFKKVVEKGIGVDGSSVPGFKTVEFSDMRLKPDLDTFFIDPLRSNVLSVYGDIYLSGEDHKYEDYPRYILYKAVEYLRKKEIADDIYMLPELEFYIFEEAEFDDSYFFMDFMESKRIKSYYHAAEPYDRLFELRTFMVKSLQEAGIKVKYHHHEVGGLGQHEIELAFAPALKIADHLETAKYLLKEIARQDGFMLTYMPKPIYNEPGNGLHFHMYLIKNGTSIFYNEDHLSGLSETALYFMGGILKHARSLSAFTNPSTNSYKRLFSGFEAPCAITYSIANRTSAIRIPGYAKGKDIDIEYRPPDATMNTYLGMAAIIMAGIDGVENKIDPGDPVGEALDPSSNKFEYLPHNLEEALEELKKDNSYLTKDSVFTERVLTKWITLKQRELREVELRPHPYEFVIYF